MADFVNMIMEAQDGKLAVKLSSDLSKLLDGVKKVNKTGEMLIKVVLSPSRTDDGAVMVMISTETKLKVPEFGVGAALFYLTDDLELKRTDPRQAELSFDVEAERREIKRNG